MTVAPAQSFDASNAPSNQSLRALDGVNFFVAASLAGFGPFVALVLGAEGWSQQSIGLVSLADRTGDVRCLEVLRLDFRRTWFGNVEGLPLQQGFHRLDARPHVGSLALDGGADSRVIARAVGILAAADAIVVKKSHKLRTAPLHPRHSGR